MEIKFYPYDFNYRVKDDKVYVYLYSKLEDGSKICVIHEHQPFFYARLQNISNEEFEKRIKTLDVNGAKILSYDVVEKELLGKNEPFLKILVNYPKAVPSLARELQAWGLDCFEKDILFVHRYLRDMGIIPMTLVKAEGDFIKNSSQRVAEFQASSVKDAGKEALKEWKILAIDIETYATKKEIDPEKNPILMIAFYGVDEKGKTFQKVITWKRFKHKLDYLEVVSDEVELLKRFREIMLDYQPDIVTGYFSDGFDFPYIKKRAEKYRVKLDIALDKSEMKVYTGGGLRASDVRITGILHIDILKFIKHIFGMNLKTDSYSLDAVSEELLGHNKQKVNLDELAHIWDHEPDQLEDFCSYNLHDSHLTYKLCHQLLPDVIEFTKIVGLPTFDVIRMRFARLVENYILKRAMEFNVLAPNKPAGSEIEQRQEEHVQGAFVFEPVPGLYEDIVVFDFRSLYPTVIMAHNIGPESFQCSCCKNNERVPERENYWFCKDKKFIPSVLEQLILRRGDIKRLIKEQKEKGKETKILEARSYALKTLANSFYGYLGFFGARWYCLECVASTTAYARDYIKKAIKKAEEKGFKVIYADTDSCFLLLGDKIIDQAMAFMNEVNFDLPGHMELEFEGYFQRGLFVSIKGSAKGAKKKYALMRKDGTLKITGFEFVRRNWSLFAREVQKKTLGLVLDNKVDEALAYVKEMVKELKEGRVDFNKLVLRTQITRELSKYSSIGPHVAIARKMEERGEKVKPGFIVEYLIGKGSGLVRDRAVLLEEAKNYDAEYYLNHQLLPAVLGIFQVLGYSEGEIMGEGRQEGLGAYFS